MTKKRLDLLVLSAGLAESREKAQRLIRAGQVTIDGHPQGKPGHQFPEESRIQIIMGERFVGRGGLKLEKACEAFDVNVSDLICVDVGSSTGGFTDCLLQRGAARVYCIDVGKGQLHWKLRNDPRVVVMEGVNARYLEGLPEEVDLAVIDVSFISLTKILPAVKTLLRRGGRVITLIKPQFEAGREQVRKGGVVKDPEARAAVVEKIRAFAEGELAMKRTGLCESPIKGPAGNVEFLAFWERDGDIS